MFLKKINNQKLIFLSFVFSFSISLLTSVISNLFLTEEFQTESSLFQQNIFIIFTIIVLVAPFIETLIFQYITIELIYKYSKNELLAVVLSALLFSIFHSLNESGLINKIILHISAFLSGIVWALIYVEAKKRKKINAFVLILSIHVFENLIGFIINNLQ